MREYCEKGVQFSANRTALWADGSLRVGDPPRKSVDWWIRVNVLSCDCFYCLFEYRHRKKSTVIILPAEARQEEVLVQLESVMCVHRQITLE